MKGDTANDDDPAATISTLNSFINVERDFSVVAADSNGGWDNFDCGMAIGNCKREQKVSLLQALTGLFTRVYMYEHRTKDARHKFKPVDVRIARPMKEGKFCFYSLLWVKHWLAISLVYGIQNTRRPESRLCFFLIVEFLRLVSYFFKILWVSKWDGGIKPCQYQTISIPGKVLGPQSGGMNGQFVHFQTPPSQCWLANAHIPTYGYPFMPTPNKFSVDNSFHHWKISLHRSAFKAIITKEYELKLELDLSCRTSGSHRKCSDQCSQSDRYIHYSLLLCALCCATL